MDAPSIGEWIGIAFVLLVILGVPAGAIFIERRQRRTGRLKFAVWTAGVLILFFLLVMVMGVADGAIPEDAGLVFLAVLIVFGAAVFFYFRQLTRRVIDIGYNKSLAFIALIPFVNLIFVLLLVFLPSKPFSDTGVSSGTEVSGNQPLYSCWCRGTDKETGEPRTSINWVLSRRAMFRVYDDRVECGDWIILFSDVKKAIAYKAKQWPRTANFIHLETENRNFQFVFPFVGNPAKHMNLELTEQNVKLQQGPITIVLRLAVVSYLAYVAWNYTTSAN